LDRRASRRQLVTFLEGIGQVLGQNRDPKAAIETLGDDSALRRRLLTALEGSPGKAPLDHAQQSNSQTEFLESLAETIESREAHKRGHARRVAFLADLLAQRIGLRAPQREELRVAAFLHDIGRLAAPGRTLASSELLFPDQRHPIEEHPSLGAKLIEPLGFPTSVADAIAHHHERYDGSGFPDNLLGQEIPLPSRILAVADAFDNLTHDHPYREGMSTALAVQEMRKQSGAELDPALVKELILAAEGGLCSGGLLADLSFNRDEDPINTIAAAAAWIAGER
jgi:putative nucleotidyltransferase with HDIG domain